MGLNTPPDRTGGVSNPLQPGGIYIGKVVREHGNGTVTVNVRYLGSTIGPIKVANYTPSTVPGVGEQVLVSFLDNLLSDMVVIGRLSPRADELSIADNLIVDSSTADTLVRFTQRGAGDVLRVEDSVNPDSTPLIVTADGSVGIGLASPSKKLHVSGDAQITGDFTVGTSTLFFDVSEDSLGIGTTTPAAKLHVTGSTSGELVRLTQTGAGNALVVEDSTNPDSTPFVIDPSGRLIVGSSSSIGFGLATPSTQVLGTTASASAILQGRYSADVSPPTLYFAKSRNATVGSHTIVQSGDSLGRINFGGSDGTDFSNSAAIYVEAEGTLAAGVVQSRFVFQNQNSSGALVERMRIDSSGNVGIGVTPAASRTFTVAKSMTGSTAPIGIMNAGQIQSDGTVSPVYYNTFGSTAAAAFTVSNLTYFNANQGTFGVGSTVTSQTGFAVASNLTGATNNYGFVGNLAAATGRWNLYMGGTANNYLAGRLGVGATLTSDSMMQVTNTTAADVALTIKGAASQSGLLLDIEDSAGTTLVSVNASGTILTRAGSAQDGVALAGRAGGTGNYEVTLTPTTLSADRTLTLPDTTGTVVTTGDSGTVTSTMILDGTIVNGDINASAAIADTKLATISTAGKVSNSATTATSSNLQNTIVARDASGNFTAGTITATLSGSASTLTTTRTIWGQNFNGSANVSGALTGVTTLTASGTVTYSQGSLSSTSGTAITAWTTSATTSNNDYLDLRLIRTSTGSDWTSAAHRIQRLVDVTRMGYIQFSPSQGVEIGYNNTSYLHVHGSDGIIYADLPITSSQSFSATNSGNQTNYVRLGTGATDSNTTLFGYTAYGNLRTTNGYNVGISWISTGAASPNGFTPNAHAVFLAGTTHSGDIRSNANNATSYNTSSDYRLKKDVVDIDDGIELIRQLKPKRFKFIDDPAETVFDGFLAHEVQDIVPVAVSGAKDAVGENGHPMYQQIDTSWMVALLTAGIKELDAKVTSLIERIEKLESK